MKLKVKDRNLYLVLFIVALGILVYKAFHAPFINDENHYIAEGLRVVNGEKYIIDIWASTFSSIFLSPFILIYKLINSTGEGIVLYMRFCYIAIKVLTSLIFYKTFKKYGKYNVTASILVLLYSPKTIRALYYGTLMIIFMMLSFCLYQKNNKIFSLLSGILYSCSVLCSPLFSLSFIVYIVMIIVNKKKITDFNRIKYFIAGIILSAFAFLLFIFIGSSVSDVLNSIKYCFDNDHTIGIPLIQNLINSAGRFLVEYYIYVALYFILIYFLCKKRKYTLIYSFVVFLVGCVLIIVKKYQYTVGGYDLLFIPFCAEGLVFYILTSKENRNNTLLTGFIISILLGISYCASSNGGLRPLCAPLVIACALSILMIKDYYEYVINDHISLESIGKYIPAATILFLIIYSIVFNWHGLKNSDLDTFYDRGTHKYMYGLKRNVEAEILRVEELDYLENKYNDGYYCFLTYDSWYYYYNNIDFITFNTYTYVPLSAEQFIQKQKTFFDLHKDKRPIYYYIEKNNDYGITCDTKAFGPSSIVYDVEGACLLKIE